MKASKISQAILAIAAVATLATSVSTASAAPSARVRVGDHWVTEASYGDTWNGTLNQVDERVSDGSRVEYFRFHGNRNDCVVIDMTSNNIDSYLELRFDRPDGPTLRRNDDGGRGVNAHLVQRLTFPGTYYIFAGSSGSGADYGRYSLSVNRVQSAC
jgi:hypothetical protein